MRHSDESIESNEVDREAAAKSRCGFLSLDGKAKELTKARHNQDQRLCFAEKFSSNLSTGGISNKGDIRVNLVILRKSKLYKRCRG